MPEKRTYRTTVEIIKAQRDRLSDEIKGATIGRDWDRVKQLADDMQILEFDLQKLTAHELGGVYSVCAYCGCEKRDHPVSGAWAMNYGASNKASCEAAQVNRVLREAEETRFQATKHATVQE